MAMTPEQKMYNRGFRASSNSPHDLDHWDAKLGRLGDLYTRTFLDGWTDCATGEEEYRPLYFGTPEEKAAAQALHN